MTSLALVSPSSSATSQTSSNTPSTTSTQGVTVGCITACDGCGVPKDSHLLRRCSRCKAKWYCSSRCHREDWHIHKFCCSRLPATLEPWRGNRTSVFGADYMKRLELCTEWSKAPLDDDFCHTHPAYRQLVLHERSSPFRYKPARKVRRFATPAYILVSMIRVFLMHDISSVGKAEIEIVAKLLDTYQCSPGGIYFHGHKSISIPDKLSPQEYLNLAEIWFTAFKIIIHVNHEYEDVIKHSQKHWEVVKILNKKLNGVAAGPLQVAKPYMPPADLYRHEDHIDMNTVTFERGK